MTTEQRHMALPWRTESDNREFGYSCYFFERLEDRNSNKIGEINEEANAKFIVTAVNNHDKLVQALKVAHITLSKESEWFNKTAAINTIEQALKEIEGE